jgi:queuine tRNA-ribosyltransferase
VTEAVMELTLLPTRRGSLALPAFLPDATRGFVRCVDSADLRAAGVNGLMVSSFHVGAHPGSRSIQRLGGLHRFAGWDGPIVTDSGGFQVLSLIRNNPGAGEIRPNDVVFRDPGSGEKRRLTPESVIRTQLQLGSDVVIALDDCTGVDASDTEQRLSVQRTIRWFRRSREEFERQRQGRRDEVGWPLLVGVAQGGSDPSLRRECAEALLDEGADGIGFGGWPVDASGRLQEEMFLLLNQLVPASLPIFALGVGKPEHLVRLTKHSRRFIFDCTLPTRDARHQRLYVFNATWAAESLPAGDDFYRYVYILDSEYARDERPVEPGCDCACCRQYERAFIHHLFKTKDALGERLATIHNLRFFSRLIERLQLSRQQRASVGQ